MCNWEQRNAMHSAWPGECPYAKPTFGKLESRERVNELLNKIRMPRPLHAALQDGNADHVTLGVAKFHAQCVAVRMPICNLNVQQPRIRRA